MKNCRCFSIGADAGTMLEKSRNTFLACKIKCHDTLTHLHAYIYIVLCEILHIF